MSAMGKAWRGLPRSNKLKVKAFAIIAFLFIAVVAYWFFRSTGPSPHAQSQAAEASGAGKLPAPSTPAYGRGIQTNSLYRKAEKKQEKVRAAKAQAQNQSFFPSDRTRLQMKGPSNGAELAFNTTAPNSSSPSASHARAASPGHGGAGSNVTAGQCLVPDGNGGYRTDSNGRRLVGTRLPNGQCILMNGDVYDRHGKLIVSHDVTNTTTSPVTDTNAAAAARARKHRINTLGTFLAKLDKQGAALAKVTIKSGKSATSNTNESNSPAGRGSAARSSSNRHRAPARPSAAQSARSVHGFAPGDELIAVLDTSIDSDSPSEVRFVVPSGALQGAKLMGGISLENDRVVVKMRYLSWRGHYAKIDAYAVDPATHLGSLAGDVDSHWVARLSAAFVYGVTTGARDLVMNQGTTTTTTSGSVVTRPSSSTSEILKAGAGNAADVLSQPLKKYISEPATVTVPRGTVVGVMFAEPTPIAWLPERAIKEAEQL